jgi:hypothetical protein
MRKEDWTVNKGTLHPCAQHTKCSHTYYEEDEHLGNNLVIERGAFLSGRLNADQIFIVGCMAGNL